MIPEGAWPRVYQGRTGGPGGGEIRASVTVRGAGPEGYEAHPSQNRHRGKRPQRGGDFEGDKGGFKQNPRNEKEKGFRYVGKAAAKGRVANNRGRKRPGGGKRGQGKE